MVFFILQKRSLSANRIPYFLSGEKVYKEPPGTSRMVPGLSRRPKERYNIAALSKVSSAYPLYLIYPLADTIFVNCQLSIVNFYFGMVMVSTI